MQANKPINKWLLSLALLLAAILSVTPFVDQRADAEYEQLFQRALVTFALARTINGIISVVQGTEIALQPAGVGVTLTPGEILDPVNDLVERFSWIMLGATISLGIQNVLLEVSAWWAIQFAVTALALWLIMRLWYPGQGAEVYRLLLRRTFLILMLIRFAVPVMLIANDLLYQEFLESRYLRSTEIVTAAGNELEQLSTQTVPTGAEERGDSILGSIAQAWNSTVDMIDLSGKLERMQERAGEVIQHLIQLSVVFILQTGVLPVAFLWLFLHLIRRLIRTDP